MSMEDTLMRAVVEIYRVGLRRPSWRFRALSRNGEVLSRSARRYGDIKDAQDVVLLIHPGVPWIIKDRVRKNPRYIPLHESERRSRWPWQR